jgi:DNA-binding NarL/FixJ family response regulator
MGTKIIKRFTSPLVPGFPPNTHPRAGGVLKRVTDREMEILKLVTPAKSNKEIA